MGDVIGDAGPVAQDEPLGKFPPRLQSVRIDKAVAEIVGVIVKRPILRIRRRVLSDLRPLAGFADGPVSTAEGQEGRVRPAFAFQTGVGVAAAVDDEAQGRLATRGIDVARRVPEVPDPDTEMAEVLPGIGIGIVDHDLRDLEWPAGQTVLCLDLREGPECAGKIGRRNRFAVAEPGYLARLPVRQVHEPPHLDRPTALGRLDPVAHLDHVGLHDLRRRRKIEPRAGCAPTTRRLVRIRQEPEHRPIDIDRRDRNAGADQPHHIALDLEPGGHTAEFLGRKTRIAPIARQRDPGRIGNVESGPAHDLRQRSQIRIGQVRPLWPGNLVPALVHSPKIVSHQERGVEHDPLDARAVQVLPERQVPGREDLAVVERPRTGAVDCLGGRIGPGAKGESREGRKKQCPECHQGPPRS
ncbi:hypothetical protein LV780_19755 (plasmid) [Cereibacter azotoformans]|uniref:hypothetical protein n=1 Tax=Cereibacter azotoformans TaxID=43057 RepID=UPI001F481576|nr:hypothetical protein [Cereibacter azotoformans]UIJ33134.1 hypothetical protein LV780_19755 [Cereibacter azotoformans]